GGGDAAAAVEGANGGSGRRGRGGRGSAGAGASGPATPSPQKAAALEALYTLQLPPHLAVAAASVAALASAGAPSPFALSPLPPSPPDSLEALTVDRGSVSPHASAPSPARPQWPKNGASKPDKSHDKDRTAAQRSSQPQQLEAAPSSSNPSPTRDRFAAFFAGVTGKFRGRTGSVPHAHGDEDDTVAAVTATGADAWSAQGGADATGGGSSGGGGGGTGGTGGWSDHRDFRPRSRSVFTEHFNLGFLGKDRLERARSLGARGSGGRGGMEDKGAAGGGGGGDVSPNGGGFHKNRRHSSHVGKSCGGFDASKAAMAAGPGPTRADAQKGA
ncbi:unnamed protein product, partial [Phaeothamnion confervicola]